MQIISPACFKEILSNVVSVSRVPICNDLQTEIWASTHQKLIFSHHETGTVFKLWFPYLKVIHKKLKEFSKHIQLFYYFVLKGKIFTKNVLLTYDLKKIAPNTLYWLLTFVASPSPENQMEF